MAKFEIGSKIIENNSERRGTVIKVDSLRRGRQQYEVTFEDGNTSTVLEADIHADFDEADPFERCKSGIFGSYSEYAKKNTTFKIRNSNNNTISSLKASKTLFRAYQFKPLLKFLNSPNHRLLVADEVGLGKTIEAGHIMMEFKARRELDNVLIVCPKSLQEKWKAELSEKFGMNFKIYETSKDLISDLKEPRGNIKAIINYEKIRMPKSKGKKEENQKNQESTNLASFLSENPFQFNLVLCDEAHKMRNSDTQTYKGAEIIMSHADAVLFLTATPIMISEENLYNLLHLLDNTKYFNYQIFLNHLRENRPFIEALTKLTNHKVSLQEILSKLLSSMVEETFFADEKEIYSDTKYINEIYRDDPLFQEIIQLLQGEDNPKVRARLEYLLSEMSIMNTVFSRTRKREVITDMSQAERSPHHKKVDLYEDERNEFDNIIQEYIDDNSYDDYWGEECLSPGMHLGLIQRKRMIASSVWGYLNDDNDLDKGIDRYAAYPDSKVDSLVEIIEEAFKNGSKKIVVFAVFRRTLKYLKIRLKLKGYNALMIHGMIDNRHEILERFKRDKNIHILLSSEVGSEGLDMQFCNVMVNYDLPWNPMVVEQRIGRIDRFGQKAKYVNIYNLIVSDSIQEEIYMRLLERIGIFKGTIGDMEAILDAPMNGGISIQDVYNKMEREFFTKVMTKEERENKIRQIELAIENEKENLQHLQEGLNNTLTNDAYFKNEIERILYKNAYVTEEELKNYIKAIIHQKLTTCNLLEFADNVMEFQIPPSEGSALRNFIEQYHDNSSDESTLSAKQFKNKIQDLTSFRLTFNQAKAYEDYSLFYFNIYHPMIQACLNYFRQFDKESNTSFSYSLSNDELLKKGDVYYMALYQLTTNRTIHGMEKKFGDLIPVVYNAAKDKLVEDENLINHIYRRSQTEGAEHNASNSDIKADLIDNMKSDFTWAISEEKKRRIDECSRQMESNRLRNVKQIMEYYKSRIDNHLNNISHWEYELEYIQDEKELRNKQGAIRLANANITTLENDRDERLAIINQESKPTIEDKILSINLITIV
ncbi:MAG: DEAD/DEAH box helicase [Muribaculaceae bacterium]|nr:DEAD/DEAH box helicase [Muribaculaceae bacterium]